MDSSANPNANGSGNNPDEDETSQMAAVPPPGTVVWPEDPWASEGSASEPETEDSTPQVTSPVIPTWPEAFGEPSVPAHSHPEPEGDNLDTAQFATPTTPVVPAWPEKQPGLADVSGTKPPEPLPPEAEKTKPPAARTEPGPSGDEPVAGEPEKAEGAKVEEKPPETEAELAAKAAAAAEAAAAFEASAAAQVEAEANARAEAEAKAIADAEAATRAEAEAKAREEEEAAARAEAEAKARAEAEETARVEAEIKAKADAEAAAELAAAQAAAAKAVEQIPVQQVKPGEWPGNPPIPSWAPKVPAPGAVPAAEAGEHPSNVPTWAPQSTSHGWSSQPGTTHAGSPAWGSRPGQDAAATQISSPPKPAAAPAQPAAPVATPAAPAPPPPPAPAARAPQPAQPAPSRSSWEVVDQRQDVEPAYAGPTAEDRSYSEWFAWAKRSGAPAQACHAAAQGAFRALSQGHDMNTAVQWATLAMASPPGLVGANRQLYCAWFSLGAIDLKLPNAQAHAFATGAIKALDGGADSMVAHQAGLQAAGITG